MIAGHLVLSMYGFWLPNDPRGSWSTYVGSQRLYPFGPATTIRNRRSQANDPHDSPQRMAAKEVLKYPAVRLTEEQIGIVAEGFGRYVRRAGLKVWACSILPDHTHLVLGVHRLTFPQVAIQLKGEATGALLERKLHPLAEYAAGGKVPPAFARGAWTVYLDRAEQVHRAIQYTEENLARAQLPAQKWDFVVGYGGGSTRHPTFQIPASFQMLS